MYQFLIKAKKISFWAHFKQVLNPQKHVPRKMFISSILSPYAAATKSKKSKSFENQVFIKLEKTQFGP